MERERKELELDREILRDKEKRSTKRQDTWTGRNPTTGTTPIASKGHCDEEVRDIQQQGCATTSPKTKEPPTTLIDSPNKSVQISQDERGCTSGEYEERENIQPGPIDLANREHVAGTHNLAKRAISELKGELDRKRYVAKQRTPQTFKIIGGISKLIRTLQKMAHVPTQSALLDI